MRPVIESVERRTFLSAVVILQDLEGLKADAAHGLADLNAGLKQAGVDIKAVKTVTAASHPTAAQKQALATLTKQVGAATASYKKQVSGLISSGDKAGLRLYGTLKVLQGHKTASNLAKVHSAYAALQAIFSTQNVSTTEANAAALITGINTAGTTFVTSVPEASTAVATAESHLAADQTTLVNDIAVIQAGVTKLGTDLP